MGWRYFNPNPAGLATNDCTIRAICAVTGLSWRAAHDALCALSGEMSDVLSSNRVWWAFLRGIGFRQLHLLDRCPDCYTVRDFAEANPRGVYVLGPHEHAVAVIDGEWLDSWDSGDTVPTYYFVKEDKQDGHKSVFPGVVSVSGNAAVSATAPDAAAAGNDIPDDPR